MNTENTNDEAALPPATGSASASISAHDDDLARDMACFLWECSRLRHGLFTPPEFIPLVSARLREYLTSHKLNVEPTLGADNTKGVNSPCECWSWCREGQMFLTTHHPRCSKYSPEDDAYKIIVGLLRGIEAWAQDEDGVHPECWEAYKTAKAAVWEAHLVRHESDE